MNENAKLKTQTNKNIFVMASFYVHLTYLVSLETLKSLLECKIKLYGFE